MGMQRRGVRGSAIASTTSSRSRSRWHSMDMGRRMGMRRQRVSMADRTTRRAWLRRRRHHLRVAPIQGGHARPAGGDTGNRARPGNDGPARGWRGWRSPRAERYRAPQKRAANIRERSIMTNLALLLCGSPTRPQWQQCDPSYPPDHAWSRYSSLHLRAYHQAPRCEAVGTVALSYCPR